VPSRCSKTEPIIFVQIGHRDVWAHLLLMLHILFLIKYRPKRF
jgi:hypothetical protein